MANDDILWDYSLSNTVEGRLLEAVQNRIKAMALKCISPDSVVIQKLPWVVDDSKLPYPCVIITPAPESTDWQAGTNETEEPQFGILITIVLASDRQVGTRGMGLQLEWRQVLRRWFQNLNSSRFSELAAFTDGAMYINGTVESGDKFIEVAKRNQRDAQYFLMRFRVKEPRA
jgi:hypothetical protein